MPFSARLHLRLAQRRLASDVIIIVRTETTPAACCQPTLLHGAVRSAGAAPHERPPIAPFIPAPQAVNLVFLLRLLRRPFPGAAAWALPYQAVTVADVVWAHLAGRRGGPPPTARYLRWHGMAALRLAIRFCDFGTGVCAAAHASMVRELQLPAGPSLLRSGLILLYAAGAVHLALNLGTWRLPPL